MKKNIMMRIASVLMIAVLLTTCVISGTFAKYVSTATATATAQIASWDIDVEQGNVALATTFTFAETWTDSNGSTEEDVASEKLAPGTKGSFSFEVANNSEVNAKFKISFNDTLTTDLEAFLNFTYVATNEEDEVVTADGQGYYTLAKDSTVTYTVNWEWPFEVDEGENKNVTDDADSLLGKAATLYDDITVTINAEQVD